jgi:orotate phosphoribosyltransferase
MAVDVRGGLVERGCLFLDTGNQFIGISGQHLDGYCNIDPALTDVRFMAAVAHDLAEPFADADIEAILSPAIGAIPIGHLVALELMEMTGQEVTAAWADKIKPRGFVLERNGFKKAISGKRAVVVEDMVNRMFSARSLIQIGRDAGADIVGVGAVAANSGVSAEALDVLQLVELCKVEYNAWKPDECMESGPCSEGRPIVVNEALGHGLEYQQEHPNYRGGYITLPE